MRPLVLSTLAILLCTACTVVLVDGHSMEPTIQDGKVVLMRNFSVDNPQDILGKIVLFDAPVESSLMVKRCVACPGDSLKITNGVIEAYHDGRWMIIPPFSIVHDNSTESIQADYVISNYPGYYDDDKYNMKPILVPAKNSTILLDERTAALYCRILDMSARPLAAGEEYRFTEDYYFFCGDNLSNSFDSRFWGFVPGRLIHAYR